MVMSGSQLGIQIQGRLGLPWTAQKTSLRDLDSVGSSEDLKQKKDSPSTLPTEIALLLRT